MYSRSLLLLIVWTVFVSCLGIETATTNAQQPMIQNEVVGYRLIKQTVFDSQPATVSRWVNETAYETKQVTTYKRVYETETRYRTVTTLKPITETSTRREKYTVTRPIYETTFKERQLKETTYEDTTEIHEQRYLVRKPVIETQYREERIVVRKPVTQRLLKTENVTTYKPVQSTQTNWVQSNAISNQTVLVPNGRRNKLQWLDRTTYIDPATGRSVYRRQGLHWMPQPAMRTQQVYSPVLVPQQNTTTTWVPQTVQRQTPVDVTTYVDQIETRRVPFEVQRMQESFEVHKFPVTVRKPIVTYRTEKVPVQTIKYQEEVRYREVPQTTTTWQRVTHDEPYQVQVSKLVPETREIRVPKIVSRRVDCTFTQSVPRTVMMKVPVNRFGCVVGPATPVTNGSTANSVYQTPNSIPAMRGNQVIGSSTVVGRAPYTDASPIQEIEIFRGNLFSQRNKIDENDSAKFDKPQSVLFPEKDSSPERPTTSMVPIKRTDTSSDSDDPMQPDSVEAESGEAGSDKIENDVSKVEAPESKNDAQKPADNPPKLDGPVTPPTDIDK